MDYTKSLTIGLGLGENNVAAKTRFEKSEFSGFTPKLLPILDFLVQH